jgi:hypothetical protein
MGKLLLSTEQHGMVKAKRVRSPRFSVPNKEQAVVSIGDEQLQGTLHLLSLTGGAIRLGKRVASGTLADIGINTVSGKFSATIEFLQMANGTTQAFRFVAMGRLARERLEDALNKMGEQGLRVKRPSALHRFRSLARRILSGRRAK